MRVGKDTCQWLTLSSTDHCSTRCMDVYCGVHLNLLRKGGGTTIAYFSLGQLQFRQLFFFGGYIASASAVLECL